MPIWGWVCLGLVALVILFAVYALMSESRLRRHYERNADPMVGWIVQANPVLYDDDGWDNVAQILVAFDAPSKTPDPEIGELAARVAELKTSEPDGEEEAEVAELVRDETYRPFEWFKLPEEFTGGREVYSIHVWVERELLPGRRLRHPFVRCLVMRDEANSRVLMDKYRRSDAKFKSM